MDVKRSRTGSLEYLVDGPVIIRMPTVLEVENFSARADEEIGR